MQRDIPDNVGTFETELGNLEESIEAAKENVLVTGDFNAKSPQRGETRLDRRGLLVAETIARKDLVIINKGGKPTFEREEAT